MTSITYLVAVFSIKFFQMHKSFWETYNCDSIPLLQKQVLLISGWYLQTIKNIDYEIRA